jgi:fructose-1,6-bisphosphatase I
MNDPRSAVRRLSAPVGTTLARFIAQEQRHYPQARGELSQLLADLAFASKIINRDINRAGLIHFDGGMGEANVQDEEQMKLDVIADTRFMRSLRRGGQACCLISEENEGMIDTGHHNASYVVAIDPLDGSSNIDVNVAIGTIFSIYRRTSPLGTPPTLGDVLQSGEALVASGYILYGSSTVFVYTTGRGVNGFTYEPSLGDYILSHPSIRTPDDGKIYSVNEGNSPGFPAAVQAYLKRCQERRYSGRYIGSLVADFHRNLLKGGIYLYPPTDKAPNGKLRLQYECCALALIVEQAGGLATDGTRRILDIAPERLHQRAPLYIGSSQMVRELQEGLPAS